MNLTIGAGNLQIQIPKGIESIRIVPRDGSLTINQGVYELVNGGYESKNFAQATIKSTLILSAGSAKLSIKEID